VQSIGSTLSAGHPGTASERITRLSLYFYSALDSSLSLMVEGIPAAAPGASGTATACDGYVLETHGTLCHGQRVTPDLLVWAVGALAEGSASVPVARVFEVDPKTVLHWLVERRTISRSFPVLPARRPITQVQLDELYALLSAVKAGEVSDTEAIQCLSRSPHWAWAANRPHHQCG